MHYKCQLEYDNYERAKLKKKTPHRLTFQLNDSLVHRFTHIMPPLF